MAELPTINLPRAQRGILVGCVGSGKSTLGTELVRRFLQDEPRALVGLIDSKPRYRAEWSINGTRMRYHDWAAGDTLAGSVALHHAREFPQARLQSRCLILQSLYPNRQLVEDFEEEAEEPDEDQVPELSPGPREGQREAVQARALLEKAERLLERVQRIVVDENADGALRRQEVRQLVDHARQEVVRRSGTIKHLRSRILQARNAGYSCEGEQEAGG
jgi:hypothetical protein